MDNNKVEMKVPNIPDGAESTLKIVATVILVVGIIGSLIIMFAFEDRALGIGFGIAGFLSSLLSWATCNVLANISLRLKALQESIPLKLVEKGAETEIPNPTTENNKKKERPTVKVGDDIL